MALNDDLHKNDVPTPYDHVFATNLKERGKLKNAYSKEFCIKGIHLFFLNGIFSLYDFII